MTLPAVLTSLHGRKLGLDVNGALVCPGGLRVEDLMLDVNAMSTAATVNNGGVGIHSSTGAQAFTLEAPVAGMVKHIILNSTSTSTAARTVTLASGNFQSTASSTYTILTFNAASQSCTLIGLSTARFQVMANNGVTLS